MIPEISGTQAEMVRVCGLPAGCGSGLEQENVLLRASEKVADPPCPLLCTLGKNTRVGHVITQGTAYANPGVWV